MSARAAGATGSLLTALPRRAALLQAVLRRPVTARPVANTVIAAPGPVAALQLPAGCCPLRVLTHVLFDQAPPAVPVGRSTVYVIASRLPPELRAPVRRGAETLDAVLERCGAYWSTEIRRLDWIPDTARDGPDDSGSRAVSGAGVPAALRLHRLIHLLGTPVAVVVEDITMPGPLAAAGTPEPRAAGSWRHAAPAPTAPPTGAVPPYRRHRPSHRGGPPGRDP